MIMSIPEALENLVDRADFDLSRTLSNYVFMLDTNGFEFFNTDLERDLFSDVRIASANYEDTYNVIVNTVYPKAVNIAVNKGDIQTVTFKEVR